jgi:hypothetical protein
MQLVKMRLDLSRRHSLATIRSQQRSAQRLLTSVRQLAAIAMRAESYTLFVALG